MRIARIFVREPSGAMFDIGIENVPMAALTHSWRSDGFILPDPHVGPYIPFSNVALIMVYEAPALGEKPGGTVLPFAIVKPELPKEPA
jgi:hypothetical protein